MFGTKHGPGFSNISLDMVIDKLKKINKNYLLHYEKGFTGKDVLVAEIHTFSLNKILGQLDELAMFIKTAAMKIINRFGYLCVK
jgi:hypothetical protein